MGEPGKRRRLNPVGRESKGFGRGQRQRLESCTQPLHQVAIVCATTTDKYLIARRQKAPDRVGDAARCQFRQCCLYVLRTQASRDLLCQPARMEIFTPGAFWRRSGEVGIGEQFFQKCVGGVSAGSPLTRLVMWFPKMLPCPGIEQRIAGAGIEAAYRLRIVCREIRDIGNTADVDDRPRAPGRVKQVLMKRRHQRCALAAGGDIARAKVGHGGDTGTLGNHRRVADLEAERKRARGAVTHRLSMAADGVHVFRRQFSCTQNRQRRGGKQLAEFGV